MSEITTVEEGIAALDALFDSPEHWTKGALARDEYNMICYPWNEEAVCWCLMGSIYKVLGVRTSKLGEDMREHLRNKIATETGTRSGLSRFNDSPDTDFEKLKTILR